MSKFSSESNLQLQNRQSNSKYHLAPKDGNLLGTDAGDPRPAPPYCCIIVRRGGCLHFVLVNLRPGAASTRPRCRPRGPRSLRRPSRQWDFDSSAILGNVICNFTISESSQVEAFTHNVPILPILPIMFHPSCKSPLYHQRLPYLCLSCLLVSDVVSTVKSVLFARCAVERPQSFEQCLYQIRPREGPARGATGQPVSKISKV